LFINYHLIIAIAGCPPGFSSSRTARKHTNSAQHTDRAAGQLSRFHHKRPVAFKFAEYKHNGLSRVESNVGGLLQT